MNQITITLLEPGGSPVWNKVVRATSSILFSPRLSVNRSSAHAKEELSKESAKDEARMRADSLTQQVSRVRVKLVKYPWKQHA